MFPKERFCVALILAKDNRGAFFNIITDRDEANFREKILKRVGELREGKCEIMRIFIRVCEEYNRAFNKVKKLARDFCRREGIFLKGLDD